MITGPSVGAVGLLGVRLDPVLFRLVGRNAGPGDGFADTSIRSTLFWGAVPYYRSRGRGRCGMGVLRVSVHVVLSPDLVAAFIPGC